MAKNWTTKLDTAISHSFGVEVHLACYAPIGWPGQGSTVCLGLPECELILTVVDKNGVPNALVNRPSANLNTEEWVQLACETANERTATIMFNCDTKGQLAEAINQAERLLPRYERVALERMYDPKSRSKDRLS